MIYNDNENNLADILDNIESFSIFTNGKTNVIDFKMGKFLNVKNKLKDVFNHARLMPAFGVSLHEETQRELESGNWLQINFQNEQTQNGLSFNSLLFKLEETQGFNLIRLFNKKYEGRCLFLDLDETIDLLKIIE